MKKLRLDTYREVTVSDEAYEQILPIVNANKVCGTCRQPYPKDFPQVSQNLCLQCFQKKYANKALTYIGLHSRNDQGDETHLFMDTKGYVSSTSTSSENEPYSDNFQTLLYWGFPVPKFSMDGEKQVELSTWNWHIYGDVRKHSVLYIEHNSRLSDAKPVAFLTTKHGDTELFTRRKGKYRKLYQDAVAKLEATKDGHGEYHIGEYAVYGLYPAYIYEMIAEIASTEYDKLNQNIGVKGGKTTLAE